MSKKEINLSPLLTDLYNIFYNHFIDLRQIENSNVEYIENLLNSLNIEYKQEDGKDYKFTILKLKLDKIINERVKILLTHYFLTN